ncbi:D-alanyl-D-alanine carboxypeptidase family protein [Kribbella sp. NPDC049227]|uniref:D-alanyl-D-alanine carboxypeptidase family protein n=1 Tax=Kribbella sp. NPDC049227 TaxID=3364113 RepID=UPI003715BB63
MTMSQTFAFEEPTAAGSPFRLGRVANLGEGGYAEAEVPDRELELFELLQAHLESETGEPEAFEDEDDEGPEYEGPEAAEYELDDPDYEEPAAGEAENPVARFFRLPIDAIDALGKGSYAAAVALLGTAGHRSENDLTNVIFYFRHPEVLGRKILPHERELQRDWLQIRNTIVRPILQRRTTPTTTPGTPGRTSISSAGLRWYGPGDATPELLTFMRAVYDRQVALSQGPFVDTLPESAVKRVEGGHRALAAAADAAISMLAAARADLATEGRTDLAVGITSAYRSAAEQYAIWQGKGHGGKRGFPYYYRQTERARQAAPGGEHGPAAVLLLAKLMKKCIAAPGYSNHQDGLAFDLGIAEKGRPLKKINTDAWFHQWLVKNAARFDFHPYPTEAWHWVYRPTPTSTDESESWHPDDPSSPADEELYPREDPDPELPDEAEAT